ncbi:DUF5991 domain-containing protein [Hymenobacter chitinivorans]|uniref:Uncharacterized protein n=1 Tax=Hymenobacter chitinivorans DSM 11115 TaxID=1121954 RepID=A0A2M9BR77_9BACT|nr:DUF5991 domain-containing protein [Hymenobacter chitinivorans]PJJ60451.1 hypothetical protein CLV45_1878 [Hymenobacter chitinivorans DSM 11115]
MLPLLLRLVIWLPFPMLPPTAGGLTGWAGTYRYEEAPVKALAGYSMGMSWQLQLQAQPAGSPGGTLSVEGQQTFMKLQVRAVGTPQDAQVVFVRGLEGNGYQQLQPGDVLFRLHQAPKAKLLTYWGKLQPRLSETYRDGQPCFRRTATARP